MSEKFPLHGAQRSARYVGWARGFALPWLVLTLALRPAVALVGDTTTADAELTRHVVMVLKSVSGRAGFCSGVFIDFRIVLTAAHCVSSPQATKVYANTDGRSEFASILDVAIHPQYRQNTPRGRQRSIDLALLRLDRGFNGLGPAVLGPTGSIPLGTPVRIAGFGVAVEGNGHTGGVLRSGVLVVRAPLSSILLWLADPMQRGTGACAGDSGAPIFIGSALTAIVNWAEGAGTSHCGSLTQAALLSPQRGWIDTVLRDWSTR